VAVQAPPDASPAVSVRASPEGERVELRDGSVVTVRTVRKEDEAALHTFLSDLCPEARRLRYFSGAVDLDKAAHWAADTTTYGFGLLAHEETGVLLAHAVYVRLAKTRAEVAVEVADHLHGRGLGTLLIERLAVHAEKLGITHFVAEVLSENRAMLEVFREGFDARVVRRDGPEERIEFLTSGWRLAHERFDATVS
jgi:L-amino acid N-acyltransferase YncA